MKDRKSVCVECSNICKKASGVLPVHSKKPSKEYDRDELQNTSYHNVIQWLEEELHSTSSNKLSTLMYLQIVVFLALLGCLIASLTIKNLKNTTFLRLHPFSWIALAMFLFSGLSVIRWCTSLVLLGLMNQRMKQHRYAAFFIDGLKRCVDAFIWSILIFLTWYLLFLPRLRGSWGHKRYPNVVIHYVNKTSLVLVLGAIFWVIKRFLYLSLEAQLHYNQLCERIVDTVVYFHGIKIITTPDGGWKFLKNLNKNIFMELTGDSFDPKTVPIWMLKLLADDKVLEWMKDVQSFSNFKSKDEQALMKTAEELLKKVIDPREYPKRNYIVREDLEKYSNNEVESKELDKLLKLFANGKDKKRIRREEFLRWAVAAYKNCRGLRRTLRNSRAIFRKFNVILDILLAILIVVIWLLTTKILATADLALLFSPFLAATFMFGNSCKNMFDGLIYAFAMHPFDVGDRVVIDGKQMKVRNLKIMTTVFYKYEDKEEVIYPNSALAEKEISNLDITPDQSDCLEFPIAADTLVEDIIDLENRIKKFLDEAPAYSSRSQVVIKTYEEDKILVAVHFNYLVSYLDAESKARHKYKIFISIMDIRQKMKNRLKDQRKQQTYTNDSLTFTVSSDTTLGNIEKLEERIIEYLSKQYQAQSKVVVKLLPEDTGSDEAKEVHMAIYLSKPEETHINDSVVMEKVEELKIETRCDTGISGVLYSQVTELENSSSESIVHPDEHQV